MDALERPAGTQTFLVPLPPSTGPHSLEYRRWLTECDVRLQAQLVQRVAGDDVGIVIAAPVDRRSQLTLVLDPVLDLIVGKGLVASERCVGDIHLKRLTRGTELYVTLRVL